MVTQEERITNLELRVNVLERALKGVRDEIVMIEHRSNNVDSVYLGRAMRRIKAALDEIDPSNFQ